MYRYKEPQILDISIGSLNEVETCIYGAIELGFINIEQTKDILLELEEI